MRQRGVAKTGPQIGRHVERRRHFHHFLMPPLHGAIALIQVHQIAVLIPQNLHFDVARAADVALQEYGAVSERGRRFLARFFQLACEFGLIVHHAHAPAAAAESRLHDQRKTDILRDAPRLRRVGQRFFGARHNRHFRPHGQMPRRRLIAQQFQQIRTGAHEGDSGRLAGSRQGRILRQKPVAGMNEIDLLVTRQRDNAIHVQVRLHRPETFPDLVGFVGFEAVQAEPVFLGIHGDRTQTQFGGRPHDADRDLTPI